MKASEKDIGKLCYFWNYKKKFQEVSVLLNISDDGKYYTYWNEFVNCQPLSAEEIQQFLELVK